MHEARAVGNAGWPVHRASRCRGGPFAPFFRRAGMARRGSWNRGAHPAPPCGAAPVGHPTRRRGQGRAGVRTRSARVATARTRRRPVSPSQAGHERMRAHGQAHQAQADSRACAGESVDPPGSHAPSGPLRPRPRRRSAGAGKISRRAFPQVRGGRDRQGPSCAGSTPEHDRIPCARPSIFSQLHICAETLALCLSFALVTWQERTARYAFTRRGRAMIATRTSQCRS